MTNLVIREHRHCRRQQVRSLSGGNSHNRFDLNNTQIAKIERKSNNESIFAVNFGLYLRDESLLDGGSKESRWSEGADNVLDNPRRLAGPGDV